MTVFIINDIVIAYKTEKAYKMSQDQKESTGVYINKKYAIQSLITFTDWCFEISSLLYLILTVVSSIVPSKKAGFLYGHNQIIMVSDITVTIRSIEMSENWYVNF